MTRVLEKSHLDEMISALRMAFRPGLLSFEIGSETVSIAFARNGRPILRAVEKKGGLWIISHSDSLFA